MNRPAIKNDCYIYIGAPALLRLRLHSPGDVHVLRSAMMVMGYFRSSTKSATSSSAAAPAAAAGKNKKKAKNSCAPAHEEACLREALLDQPAAAAAEGGVPKGYFAVYAGEESRRFVVPTGYLREPAFRDLMERAADEFGFAQAGGLRVPCAEEDFEDLLRRLQRKNGGAAAGKGKKAVVGR